MSKKIFWGIDETLIYTPIAFKPKDYTFDFTLGGHWGNLIHYTFVRPSSLELIEFSREIVGNENVHILTTSVTDYANAVNKGARWGFREDQIIARETLKEYTDKAHAWARDGNILIDNLPFHLSQTKVKMMGIKECDYIKVDDYYGQTDIDENEFCQRIKDEILRRHRL